VSPYRSLQIRGLCDSPVDLPQFLDEIPVGIIVFNTDRKVVLVNHALEALTGFPLQEAYGIPCQYILRSNLCVHGCQMKLVGQESEPVCAEANVINRNRQKIPVRLTTAPILDTKGNLVRFRNPRPLDVVRV
jgi:two-component system, NtrC family, response regulator AtoC